MHKLLENQAENITNLASHYYNERELFYYKSRKLGVPVTE